MQIPAALSSPTLENLASRLLALDIETLVRCPAHQRQNALAMQQARLSKWAREKTQIAIASRQACQEKSAILAAQLGKFLDEGKNPASALEEIFYGSSFNMGKAGSQPSVAALAQSRTALWIKALESALGQSEASGPFVPDAALLLEKGMEGCFDLFFRHQPAGKSRAFSNKREALPAQDGAAPEDKITANAAEMMAQALFELFGEIYGDLAQTGLDTGAGCSQGIAPPPVALDPVLLCALGFDAFAQDALELVDADKTLGPGGAAGIAGHFAALFPVLSSRLRGQELAVAPLHFPDAKSWLHFLAAYSSGSILRAGVENLFFFARAAALAQTAGPLPVQAFEQAAATLNNPAINPADARKKAVAALPENWFSAIPSSEGILARSCGHKALAALCPSGEALAKSSWLKAITEKGKKPENGPAELLKAAKDAAGRFSSEDSPRYWLCLDTALTEIIQSHAGLMHAKDALPGDLSAILDSSCRILGPLAWARTLSAACARSLCADMAFCLVYKGGLDRQIASALNRLGMESVDPAYLAGFVSREADNTNYLLPENLAPAPAAALRTFLLAGVGLAAEGSNGPRPSPAGAAMNFLLALPGAPWGENAASPLNMDAQLPGPGGLARFIANLPLLAWLKTCAQKLAVGSDPPSPANESTWTRAANLSGATGLYADWLFDRLKNLETGPTSAHALLETALALAKNQPQGQKTFVKAIEQTPFVNLNYAKTALDWSIASV
ncbi:MAG: hypothetical protein QMD09_05575 [Desulfatibacillaceae bacterium]|nr:hypothetical protein [Desulfatibacillaceae bacterium]